MQLKQKFAITLCLYYLICTVGLALSLHFCGGKLATVAAKEAQAVCKYCAEAKKMVEGDGCCKNTKVEVKVKDNHQLEAAYKLPKLFATILFFHPAVSQYFGWLFSSVEVPLAFKAPPKIAAVALHIFNCVFRN